MRPYRVLFLLHSDARAGLEEHVLSLLQTLSRQQFVLGLVCPIALVHTMAAELKGLPLEVFPVQAVQWSAFRDIRRLWGILRTFRPDILHCHLFRATLVGAPLGRAAGVPVILETYHGREVWRHGPLKGRFFVDRFVARWVDQIIAVSEAAARFLRENKGIPAQKITVIPNGRDLHAFGPGKSHTRALLRQHWGIPDNAPVVGVVGRLEAQKGHRFLVEALPQVLTECPDVCVLLVGEGSLRPALEAQATILGIRDRIIFAGFQHDVSVYLNTMDVVVLPSLYEGMPLAAIEAAAMAKPVVATSVDGTAEVIQHGRTGLLVPPSAPGPLARAILTLLQQPELARQYGQAARKHALHQFDLRRQVGETERLYVNTMAATKRR
jgi:glycosyltransferase involved in cell wall biosynthesis